MDVSTFLKIGDLMEVEVEDEYASTKVEEVDGSRLVVDYLTSRGRPVHLQEKEKYTLIKKSGQGLLFFLGRYEGRYKENNRYFMVFTALTEPQKSQRRMSFRVPVLMPVKVLVVSNVVMETIIAATRSFGPRKVDQAKDWLHTNARDISEEGMLIHIPLPPPIGAHVMVQFEINGKPMFANAIVRRHAYAQTTDTRPNMMGIQFLELDEKEMRTIRKFVIDYQIELRLKDTDQLI